MQDAGVFAQQIAALLQLQERWRELEQLAQLHGDLSLSLDDDAIAGHLTDTAHALLRTSYTDCRLFRWQSGTSPPPPAPRPAACFSLTLRGSSPSRIRSDRAGFAAHSTRVHHTDSVYFANNPERHRIVGSTSGIRFSPSRIRSD